MIIAIAEPGEIATAPDIGSDRIASLDVLRGLVVTLMIFVNDVAGVDAAPGWLKHAGTGVDAMTLPDTVFPAFLFLAGMSVPLALERARGHGATWPRLVHKVTGRTAALLVIGALISCVGEHNPWYRGAWGVLAYASVLLAFVVVPKSSGRRRTAWRIARVIGWLGVIVLALTYKTQPTPADPVPHHLLLGPWFDASDPDWLRPAYWGILGMIGWGYFVAAFVYLTVGRRREWLIGTTGLLLVLYVATDFDYAARLEARPWLVWAQPALVQIEAVFHWIDSQVPIRDVLASSAAVAMAGCCLGSILVARSDITTPADRFRWAAIFTIGLLAAAVLFDPPYGLSKQDATPAWCLLCAALTAAAWMLVHWALGHRTTAGWRRVVQPAGANPLLAYLLHPFLYLLAAFAAVPIDFYQDPEWPLAVNIGGSLVMAVLVVQLTGLLARTGYRLSA